MIQPRLKPYCQGPKAVRDKQAMHSTHVFQNTNMSIEELETMGNTGTEEGVMCIVTGKLLRVGGFRRNN